ncbi:hypothetical protein [Pseudomonas sp. ERMR1:02]|uniref:hypothetical protein n=1 Tax=unclassified Pseudomonas TaxID=196821 RepID=UPI0035309683
MTNNVAEPLLHSPQDVALMGAKHAYQTLRAGFTTVHDLGTYRAFAWRGHHQDDGDRLGAGRRD